MNVSGQVEVKCAVPTNFRQTSGRDIGNGVLYFTYDWDSSTGQGSDLSACTVDEKVIFPDGDPFHIPSPPFAPEQYPNPTVYPVPHPGD